MTSTPPTRRARHLMDPANPQRPSVGSMSITRVQQWVLSVLAATTILHLSGGLVVGSLFIDSSRGGARVGLNVLAGLCGVFAVAAARLIHRKSAFSPWLLAGLLPALVGLWLVLA